jgi:DNA-binding XRE family transcriptional regulator
MPRLTKADAARQLGISRTTLYKFIEQGKVSATPEGLIDQAELLRVAPLLDVHRERARTPLHVVNVDTQPQHDEHSERPVYTSSEQPEQTSSERQLTSTLHDLVDTMREQMQLMREELQAARQERAMLLQMLQEMQHRYDRLLDAPRAPHVETPAPRAPRSPRQPPAAMPPPPPPAPALAPDAHELPGVPASLATFDPRKHVLGKLCPRGHDYQGTGQSLRRLPAHVCLVCDRERAKERRQARRKQTN